MSDALIDVTQRLLAIADLQQLVRQIAVQHDVEAVPMLRARAAQRLVHVGKRLLRPAVRGIAAGDRVDKDATQLRMQDAQPLVPQRQDLGQRLLAPARTPQAVHQPGPALRRDVFALQRKRERRLRERDRARRVDMLQPPRLARHAQGGRHRRAGGRLGHGAIIQHSDAGPLRGDNIRIEFVTSRLESE
jgi:hypothetical protein